MEGNLSLFIAPITSFPEHIEPSDMNIGTLAIGLWHSAISTTCTTRSCLTEDSVNGPTEVRLHTY